MGLVSWFVDKDQSPKLNPIGVSYEYGKSSKVSLGGYLGYAIFGHDALYPTLWHYEYTCVLLAIKGSYHIPAGSRFDPYASLMLGYNHASQKITTTSLYPGKPISDNKPQPGGPFVGISVGARFFLNERVGIYAEAGIGFVLFQAGLTIKY